MKKAIRNEAPRVISIEDIDLHAAIEGAFRALEATTLTIDKVLEALQEAMELTKLACRTDGRAKHGLLIHRYEQLMGMISSALDVLAKGPAASGNAALAITLAQTGMADPGLELELPPTISATPAEARQALSMLEAAMRATETYAGHFRDTARQLTEHRGPATAH